MPRPREFDADAVLEQAMDLFWRQGYEATSVDDLVRTMGISRASLYATFGNKHALFLKAMDRYREHARRDRLAVLLAPGPGLARIAEFFTQLIDGPAERRRRGCMMVRCGVEVGGSDPQARRRVSAAARDMERAFLGALERAQRDGDLDLAEDAPALARLLTCTVQGLHAMGSAGEDRAVLQDVVRLTLARLS
jgi:TetR/AcrR family transcriptional regulator, transcriptional repressor for nem operon